MAVSRLESIGHDNLSHSPLLPLKNKPRGLYQTICRVRAQTHTATHPSQPQLPSCRFYLVAIDDEVT